MATTMRFGVPPPDAAEQVTLQTRWGDPDVPMPGEYKRFFPYGMAVSILGEFFTVRSLTTGANVSGDGGNIAGARTMSHHPDSGLPQNGMDTICYYNSSMSHDSVNNLTVTIEANSSMHVVMGLEGNLDNEWYDLSDAAATPAVLDNQLNLLLPYYATHPSVLAFSTKDDGASAQHGRRASSLMERVPQLDIGQRPATATLQSATAMAAVDPDVWQVQLYYIYPCSFKNNLTPTMEGDFSRPGANLGIPFDWAEWIRATRALAPPNTTMWLFLQGHKTTLSETPANASELRYPTKREMRMQVWKALGEGVKGFFWFAYNDQSGRWDGLAHPNSRDRMDGVAEMGHRLSPGIRARLMTTDRYEEKQVFTATGGGSDPGWLFPFANAYCSTLYDPGNDLYYCVIANNSYSTEDITISSSLLSGTLVNMETGVETELGTPVSREGLDGGVWRFVPASEALFWWDDAYDSRIDLSATNTLATPLYDKMLVVTLPPGVDSDSARVVETTPIGTIDRVYDWRYGSSQAPNRFWHLPAKVSGQQLTVKTQGRWAPGETRTFALYWDSTGVIPADPPIYLEGTGSTLARIGPDNESGVFDDVMSLPSTTGSAPKTKPGWARAAAGLTARAMTYTVNGVGAFNATSGTVTDLTNNGPTVTANGTINFPRSEWAGSYTCEYQNTLITGRKADNTGANTLTKLADAMLVVLTYTNQTAYTSTAIANTVTAPANFDIITLAASTTGPVSGEAAGNQIATFSAPVGSGTITEYVGSEDITDLPVLNTIIGRHTGFGGAAIVVKRISLTGFGSQSPEAVWVSDSSRNAYLQLRNLTTSSVIPAGAEIEVEFWFVDSFTGSGPVSLGHAVPDEIVALMDSVVTATTNDIGGVELRPTDKADSLEQASVNTVAGIKWMQDNAVAVHTISGNAAYEYDVQTGLVASAAGSVVDDHDANYGDAYKLAGLCFCYLRTHDPALIPLIEYQANYHVQIEQDAVAQYGGTFWLGSAPYFYWTLPTPSGATNPSFANDGGTLANAGPLVGGHAVDPNMPGGVLGQMNYSQGDVRRHTSIDQMHMVLLGLYHYRYLLRNESAITANATLWADVLAYIGRMRDFEALHFSAASSRLAANLYQICTTGTPTNANGQTDANVTNPYNGAQFGLWQISDTDDFQANPSSNVTIDNFINSVCSPNTTLSALKRYMQGQTKDMLASDYGQHDVVSGLAADLGIVPDAYPQGWLPRAAGGTYYRFSSGRTGDDHYLEVRAGYRDALNGRAPQRAACVALTALLDPTYQVPIEMTGGTTIVRSVPVAEAAIDIVHSMGMYGVEPITKAQRHGVAGTLGRTSSFHPQIIDSAFTGYYMYAVELAHLVNEGADYTDYYPIGLW